MIPLCVPFSQKDTVKKAGGKWSETDRVWWCNKETLQTNYGILKPYVPRLYRLDLNEPIIRPWMVPQSLWGKNLRSVLEKPDWDQVRKSAYLRSGYRCLVCGGKGEKWPVEADEAWYYDDHTKTSTLKGVIALCPDCHAVRHWGRTSVEGDVDLAFSRLMKFNQWTREETQSAIDDAFRIWHTRSKYVWEIDYSWVTEVHGFSLKLDAETSANIANKELVRIAHDNYFKNRGGQLPSHSDREQLRDIQPSARQRKKRWWQWK